jgi:rare lipoprotein A (peptidoglycan hydrolase)
VTLSTVPATRKLGPVAGGGRVDVQEVSLVKATPLIAAAFAFFALVAAGTAGSSSGTRVYASWYGPGFYGHRLCDNSTLTPSSMIVASRAMPCRTRIVVCYRGRCVRARVADYGPASWTGRDIDLGAGVARALGFGGVGWVTVSRR